MSSCASSRPPDAGQPGRSRARCELHGAPAPPAPRDVHAAGRPGNLSSVVRGMPAYVYASNSQSDTVDVIDQRTFRVIGQFPVGALPQHVTPSYELEPPFSPRGHALVRARKESG